VSEIVKGHGGQIEASSTDDETVFPVWIPLEAQRPSAAPFSTRRD
jgi:nitrogen-specific signal transduction histidine kinase